MVRIHKTRKTVTLTVLVVMLLFSSVVANAASLSAVKTAPDNVVCLTIDDGYNKAAIIDALNILREKKIACTFFVIGKYLTAYPDLWRQAIKDGHEICYHSMNHSSMGSWSDSMILQDLGTWNTTAKCVLGSDYVIPRLARLPGGGGHTNSRILKLFNNLGYKLIGWSVDTYTGAIKDGKSIPKYVLSKTVPGSIILTHFNSADVSAMGQYLDALKKKFTLVEVSTAVFPRATRTPKPSPTPPTTTPPPIIVWGN